MSGATYVMIGFASEEEAVKFLEYVDGLEDHNRTLLLGERTSDRKVKLTPLKIRTAYLKSI